MEKWKFSPLSLSPLRSRHSLFPTSFSTSRLRERKNQKKKEVFSFFFLSLAFFKRILLPCSSLAPRNFRAQTALDSTPWSPRPFRGRSRRSRRPFLRHLRRRRLLRRRRPIHSPSPLSRSRSSRAAQLPGAPFPRSRRARARPRLREKAAAACSEEEGGGPRLRGRSPRHPGPLSLPMSSGRPPSPRPLRPRRSPRPT